MMVETTSQRIMCGSLILDNRRLTEHVFYRSCRMRSGKYFSHKINMYIQQNNEGKNRYEQSNECGRVLW